MTADTPTPYVPPDGVILTTMGAARRVGHGQVSTTPRDTASWRDVPYWAAVWADRDLVWWRPIPERTVPVYMPESAVRDLAEWDHSTWVHKTVLILRESAQTAVAILDGDT